MKKLLTLLFLLLQTCLLASAQTATPDIATLDERYGFRGARFESTVNKYKDLVLAENGGDTKFYRRTSDVKTLGEGELSSIRYGFYRGRLAVVILETKGSRNSHHVLEAIRGAYGPGVQRNPYQSRYGWNGKTVTLSYDENAASNDATIFIYSKKLRALQLEEQNKAGKNLGIPQ
ncbi:hypothetical protein GCM10027346_02100 [Hymenobacter seoulensis]